MQIKELQGITKINTKLICSAEIRLGLEALQILLKKLYFQQLRRNL